MSEKWWLKNNLRMIQNNIRDIDAAMDVDAEVKKLKEFGANVLQIGCGGITAFSQTSLECQNRSPYLKEQGDTFGRMLKACHENDIRVIARFDVSKTHEKYVETNPEWFSRSLEGEFVHYNDTCATCVNGDYQQKYALDIIGEIVQKYPVDGIFFNMFGYQTYDYSGKYVGICQCESCKRRFKEMYGYDLPVKEDEQDPVFQKYKEFKDYTVSDLLQKISGRVHELKENVAVSTYADPSVDIIRMESNSAVDRPLPFWIYSSSENVSSVHDTFDDKISSNVAINAVDLPYRVMGVSKYLNRIRLVENMARGGGLDWCIIGTFQGYPDEENFEMTKEVFQFHKKYEKYYGKQKSQAKILLIQPHAFHEAPCGAFSEEYRGLFKMLKESHRLFDSVMATHIEKALDRLDSYEVILIPGISEIKNAEFLQKLKEVKAKVIATGISFREQREYLKENFGITLGEKLRVRGSYMLTEPKEIFTSFAKRDWVYMDLEYLQVFAEDHVQKLLPRISDSMYGPPERCFGHQVTDIPSVTVAHEKWIYLPWMIGTLYYRQGYEDFKYILLNLLDAYAPYEEAITTDAPSSVEVFFQKIGEKQYLLQLLNLSGFNGTTVGAPIVLSDIHVNLNGTTPREIYELTADGEKEVPLASTIKADKLDGYKVYVIQTV